MWTEEARIIRKFVENKPNPYLKKNSKNLEI